jgi:isoamylase
MVSVPGSPFRLGAVPTPDGVNFAVFSSVGAYGGSVSLSLLHDDGGEERLPMWPEQDVWSCRVDGVKPGQRYGFRVDGPYAPDKGLRFDRNALLVDPYAHAMTPAGTHQRALHGVVVDPAYDWGGDAPPRHPWCRTVLYETHVKGLTARHPALPDGIRGTYAGLAHPAVLEHLTGLGVTAVELLPVHQFVSEQRLLDMGLTNYWGYASIGFLAPHAGYSSSGTRGEQVREFRDMVKALHGAGIEVILDVVYNHTGEGDAGNPPLSFRGLADDVYYRQDPRDPSRYVDTTGTGNSLDPGSPQVLRLIMDSLRWWVSDMHVDGFRFDLAATLARDTGDFDRLGAFFDLVHQEPVLAGVKLIAEPWDVGAYDSYNVGRFPPGWVEWNDQYRDTVRDFWRGRARPGALATRVSGSSDLYGAARRGPDASVVFVTAHDGMTLADLTMYGRKHNEANGEDNRDGTPDDRADNHGVEGPSDDPAVGAARGRHRRSMLATMLVSQGVPMLNAGDEICRTQAGNNNAYCQDNEISWHDWTATPATDAMKAFTARAIALQAAQPALRRRAFLTADSVVWLGADGQPMQSWDSGGFLGWLLFGDRVDLIDAAGNPVRGDDVLVLCNAGPDAVTLPLPGRAGSAWTLALDTAAEDGKPPAGSTALAPGTAVTVRPGTLLVATAPA